MALDLERDGDPVAEVEDACVLSRALEHAWAVARQPPQQERRVLVAAVLRPEEGEDLELEVVRLSLEQRDDASELPVRKAEPAMERVFRDGTQAASLDAGSVATNRSAARPPSGATR
jgi:hypothetical protein